jgi:hypothetical protein
LGVFLTNAYKNSINLIKRDFKISTRYEPFFFFWLIFFFFNQPLFSGEDKPITDSLHFQTSDTLLTDSVLIASDSINNIGNDTAVKKKSEIEDPVKYSAVDSLFFDMENKTVHLYGDAHVEYQKIDLKAAYIEFNMADQTVYATGTPDSTGTNVNNPVFKDGADEFNAHWIKYNFKTKKGFVYFVKTKQGEGTLIGDSTKRSPNGQVSLKGATYSTCDLDHPHFYFQLTKAKLVPNDKVVSGPAYLVVADIPFKMIFVPFGYFPNTKTYSSGILFPSWGEENTRGFYLRDGGYYFAISDHMDARVTGEFFSKGSWGAAVQTNYKKRYKYSGNFAFNFNENVSSEKGLPDYATQNDYRLNWSHSQDQKANPNSTFSASVSMSSSEYDKRNSYNIKDYTTNTKSSSISYTHHWPNSPFSLTSSLNHNQNSNTKDIDMTLPQVAFNMASIYPFRREDASGDLKWYENIQLKYDAGLDNHVSTKDSLFLTNRMFDNMKNGFKHEIPLSYNIKITKSINITPSLQYRGMLYTDYYTYKWIDTAYYPSSGYRGVNDSVDYVGLSAGNPQMSGAYGYMDTTRHRGLYYAHAYYPQVSTGYNPKVYGMFTFKNSKVKAIRHMMSPGVSFSYVPDISSFVPNYYYTTRQNGKKDIQLSYFKDNIYGTPTPPPGQSAMLTFSLKNNLEMKYLSESDTSSKEEKITLLRDLNLSANYNLMADSFNLSNIQLTSSTSIFGDKLSINFNSTFDPYKFDTAKGGRVNSYMAKNWGKPARLTNASITMSTRFSSSEVKPEQKTEGNENENLPVPTPKVPSQIDPNAPDYSLPWSLDVNYSWSYSNTFNRQKRNFESTITQMIDFQGSLKLTKKWNLGFQSGYDFTAKDLTPTNINITRDLHCWKMSFSWTPFGTHQSYNFTINAVANILKDLKYNKRNEAWRGRLQ